MNLSEDFWDSKYKAKDIGWDLGKISPSLKAYFDQLTNKNLNILIPGGGNSYEAEYLFNSGFKNVFVVDLSKTALDNFKKRVPSFPSSQLIHSDFFKLDKTFDLLVEQTFFCAIHPKLRTDYASKAFELLTKKGKVVGLLFNVPLNQNHPPFGGSKAEYLEIFNPKFTIDTMEIAYNSIASRQEKELFFILKKNE
ncbi:methyltransferase domain-containing protein [Ulvibacter litoralis]|uniref:Thiopurine S-methyltransferase (TPMT) n=1 Tax=Ulvibacter litoralis TaxID=227084 RepID=A0A1G7I8C3_9FLAO|nr:methyltransferase domain-containing protein [Ulvibacter litoralis]GHC62188.1 SAM-dependent methyltransferase [Ulvibacter litoralis]SDF08935.1 Thiopurine S-methyltransferase (TPMT) [Ulvibacter litoralis]